MARVVSGIRHNYHPDVVLLTGLGMFRGHDGVRTNTRMLADHLDDPAYDANYLSDSDTAFIEWTTPCAASQTPHDDTPARRRR